jgi:predicted transposase YbfD/YdcC
VLALKGNQHKIHKEIYTYFEETLQDEKLYFEGNSVKTSEKGHGRIEKRAYYLSTDIDWLEQKDEWEGLKAVGAVWSETERGGKICREHRYYITTLTDVKTFAEAVRTHWGIENSLHWCLDVSFNEDKSTI